MMNKVLIGVFIVSQGTAVLDEFPTNLNTYETAVNILLIQEKLNQYLLELLVKLV
jgi:hypothetical protein